MLPKLAPVLSTVLALTLFAAVPPVVAAERLLPIKVETAEEQVRLYGSPDGGQTGARPKAGFPAQIFLIGRSDTGRLHVRFPDTNQTAWLRGRDVKIDEGSARPLECDPVARGSGTRLAAELTRGARGAGGGECR
jgi:hypothetical protein